MMLYSSQPTIKISYLVTTIFKSEQKLIASIFMDLEKDFRTALRKKMENGLFLTEIEEKILTEDMVYKHMDFIPFIYSEKEVTCFI